MKKSTQNTINGGMLSVITFLTSTTPFIQAEQIHHNNQHHQSAYFEAAYLTSPKEDIIEIWNDGSSAASVTASTSVL